MRQKDESLQSIVQDLTRQLSKYIPVSLSILERHNRGYEELDSLRLSLEELRELLSDYFDEASRDADKVAERLAQLERLSILEKTGTNQKETLEIKKAISDDLYYESLRRELIQQTKNLARTQEKAAKYGIDIPVKLSNEIEIYTERIEAIKTELDSAHRRH